MFQIGDSVKTNRVLYSSGGYFIPVGTQGNVVDTRLDGLVKVVLHQHFPTEKDITVCVDQNSVEKVTP